MTKTVSEFKNWIQEMSLWRQFDVQACLVRFDKSEQWHIAFLQILLREKEAIKKNKMPEYEHLRFINKTYDITTLDAVLEDLEEGQNIRLEGMDLSLDLLQSNIFGELHVRQYMKSNFGIDEACYLLTRTGEFSKLRDIIHQIESEIKKVDPPFESLRDLCYSKFGIDFGTNAFPLFIRIFCPLYAKIMGFYIEGKKLYTELQLAAKLNTHHLYLSVIGKNKDDVPTLRKTVADFPRKSGPSNSIVSVDMQDNVSILNITLHFENDPIDEFIYLIENPRDDLKKGIDYVNLQQYDKALLSFSKAIDADPNNHDLLIQVAELYVQLGKYDEASEIYDKILRANPRNSIVLYKKGLAFSDLGKFWDAIKYYDLSLEINPKNSNVWNYRGLALVDLGRYQDAIKSFDKYLELKPDDPYVLNTKGLCIDHLGDRQKALELYEAALKINPNVAEAWNNKGFIYNELGKYEDALKSYDKALEINGNDFNAWHNKGIVLLTIGDFEAALDCFDTAVKLNNYLAPAWFAKGQTLEKLQRYDESIESFKRAESIDPKYSIMRALQETPLGQVQDQVDVIKSEILSKTIDPNVINETRRRMGITDKIQPTKLALASLGIKNIKAIQETLLKFKPITLLFGPNSSGKSTVLHTILLLKQTLEGRDRENSLLLNGRYINSGSPRDVFYLHDLNRKIDISLNMENLIVPIEGNLMPFSPTLKLVFEFDKGNKKVKLKETNMLIDEGRKLVIKNGKIFYHYQNKIQKILLQEVYRKNFLYLPQGTNIPSLEGYLDAVQALERMNSRSSPKSDEERKFMNQDINLIKTYLGITDKVSVSAISNGIRILRSYSDRIYRILTEQTYYVGPLRVKPSRHYITTGELHDSVGPEGEYVYDLLLENSDKLREIKLKRWLTQMNLTNGLEMARVSDEIFSVIFTDPATNLPINSVDAGFGTSQLLPIVVQSIWAPKDSLILLEQPEIHLHPQLQGTLADLFIEMKNEGKQFIVETHSEHILLRIQRRIAEQKLSKEDVAIYYFEMKENGSIISEIKLNANGTLREWPKGFFEEDLTDSSKLLEALAKNEDDAPKN